MIYEFNFKVDVPKHDCEKTMNIDSPSPLSSFNKKDIPIKSVNYLFGFLSFLIPGLGHIFQNRVFKGLLFFICINFLFFYGWYLGSFSNVYLPRATECQPRGKILTTISYGPVSIPFPKSLYYRLQYAGQFWVGLPAWPALVQFLFIDEEKNDLPLLPIFGKIMRAPSEQELNQLQTQGTIVWELAWIFTVSAGLLNLLVAYDCYAGPILLGQKVDQ